MLKSRLRGSFSPLFTGEHSVISLKAMLVLFNRCYAVRQVTSFHLIGVESLKRSFHSCSDEEDDFSELDSPMEKGVGTIPKLMTEKPEHLKKSVGTRKAPSCSSLPSESSRNVKDSFSKPGNCSSAPHLKHENKVHILKTGNGSHNFKSTSSVTIENVSSVVHLPQLKEAISIFGKISYASMRTVPKGLDCCDIEFESVESRNRAVSAGSITVGNFNLPIHPLHAQDIVTIRIGNISSETADSAIHSTCMSCGHLEGLVRKDKDAVDALFTVKDSSDAQSILEKLNNTIVDNCKWLAHLKAKDLTSVVVTNEDSDAQLDLGFKISSHVKNFKEQISLAEVYREDLEYLHSTILHLQNRPATGSYLSSVNRS